MEENTPQDTAPQEHRRSVRKAGIIGGVIGSIGLAASIFALTATAGAATSTLAAQDTDSGPDVTAPEADTLYNDTLESDEEVPEDYAAAEVCWVALEEKFNLHDLEDKAIEDKAAWEAFEAEADTCEALLPQDVKDEIAAHDKAFGPYEKCVDAVFEEQGFDDEGFFGDDVFGDDEMFDFGPAVSIITDDAASFAEFGEGDGHVTITKTGDDFAITSDGDVTIEDIDWDAEFEGLEGHGETDDAEFEAFDAALSSCDDKLPEGFDFDGDFGLFDEAEADDGELAES